MEQSLLDSLRSLSIFGKMLGQCGLILCIIDCIHIDAVRTNQSLIKM